MAARRSLGMGSGQGVAPWAARARILEPLMEMKSLGRELSIAFMR